MDDPYPRALYCRKRGVPDRNVENAGTYILLNSIEKRPYYRMDEIFRMQEFISSKDRSPNSPCRFQDSFGNQQEYDTKHDDGTLLVELRSLRYSVWHVRLFKTEIPVLYSPTLLKGNPAVAATNESLLAEPQTPISRDPRDSPARINLERVREIFVEGGWHFLNSEVPAGILNALQLDEMRIDNIVCFDLGTIEADVCGPHAYYHDRPGLPRIVINRYSASHAMAFMIRDFISAHPNPEGSPPPQLIFQHYEYTDDTVTVLKESGCIVFRDTTSAFRYITRNTLIIWTGKEGPMSTPVKQIIADFPFQDPPLPLPAAMIWPREPADFPHPQEIGIIDFPRDHGIHVWTTPRRELATFIETTRNTSFRLRVL
ncbi:hypothetical protein F4859DRAFT_522922 [Xylaria cf. heliscus]|nr:hypothetical protein F4859DRAFT_522922 [Xylaria cf. heliscus]